MPVTIDDALHGCFHLCICKRFLFVFSGYCDTVVPQRAWPKHIESAIDRGQSSGPHQETAPYSEDVAFSRVFATEEKPRAFAFAAREAFGYCPTSPLSRAICRGRSDTQGTHEVYEKD